MTCRIRNLDSPRHILSIVLLLSCLAGIVLAQTFQYSRGWTNGKKRSGSTVVPESGDEILGLCQMMRLKEVIQSRHRDQAYLPCEILGKPEDEIIERFRRKADLEDASGMEQMQQHQHEQK